MNILITGASGFVGNSLREYFTKQGHRVTGTVGRKQPREGEIQVDISNPDSLMSLKKENYDIIIHSAAALEGSSRKILNKVNVTGTQNIIKLAKECNCKHFIHISSVSVYGLKALGENRTEDTRRSSKGSFYGASKKRAEELVENSNLDYTILRLPVVIGENDSFVSPIIIDALKAKNTFYRSDKERRISMLNVRNLPHIIEKFIECGANRDYYNCIDHTVPWSYFIQQYSNKVGIRPRFKTKNLLTAIIRSLGDERVRFTTMIGQIGMYYENRKLMEYLGIKEFPYSWFDAVHQACIVVNK